MPASLSQLRLYQQLHPSEQKTSLEIIQGVATLSFQFDLCEADLNIIQEDCCLSLARQSARDTFIDIRDGLGWDETSEESQAQETLRPSLTEPSRLNV